MLQNIFLYKLKMPMDTKLGYKKEIKQKYLVEVPERIVLK